MIEEYYLKTGVCYDDVRQSEKIFLIYTYKCNASCAHCLTESDPLKSEKLSPELCRDILDAGLEYDKNWLMISGGEALLYPREIEEVLKYAHGLGYYCCVGTNAFWAKTNAIAEEKLARLQNHGLDAIFPSATAYHSAYVPTERVLYLRDAATKLGLVCEVNFYPSPNKKEDARILSLLSLENDWYTDGLITTGRDVSELSSAFQARQPRSLDDCGSLHLAFTPRGDAICNCNVTYRCDEFRETPFHLGNFLDEPLQTIFARERDNRILQFMMSEPRNLVHAVLAEDEEVRDGYLANEANLEFFSATAYYLCVLKNPAYLQALDRAAQRSGIA
ncbi:MAG TPA: radical SAM protein [Propylenella sp.]|nr:radical SAM protein [Propylenella sp.]